jgi:hypothetical protein
VVALLCTTHLIIFSSGNPLVSLVAHLKVKMHATLATGKANVRVTVATKRLNGFFREIELLENRIFNPLRTIYFNYSTFNVSHVLHSTKNASKD